MVVQGAVNPDEFYVYKPTLAKGKPAILRRSLGSKQLRMVYSDTPGERVRTEDTPAELRGKFSLSDEDVHELSKQALVIEKHYQRPMDRSEEHTSELQSLMRTSYAVFCLK